MTRILIQRGSGSSNQSRSGLSSSVARPDAQLTSATQVFPASRDGEIADINPKVVGQNDRTECSAFGDSRVPKYEEHVVERSESQNNDVFLKDDVDTGNVAKRVSEVECAEKSCLENEVFGLDSGQHERKSPRPPPPPLPPPKPSPQRPMTGSSNSIKVGSPKLSGSRPVVMGRTSPSGSRPSSPNSIVECEGYNSADEQISCVSTFDDLERERHFEIEIRRVKGFELRRMIADGNCLFRAVADQVYGDSEAYDVVRQMCLDYMERERDHFSQFITEGFISYCKRKRRNKVYGNNVEIQALSEMYNRPIHIYSYYTEPINTFHGNYCTDSPPIRLSYHHGNLMWQLEPALVSALFVGYAPLEVRFFLLVPLLLNFFSSSQRNVDKNQIKAAIKAQQDQQIDNALVAEGRFYSDLELTEKEIERMVMEASRAEYHNMYLTCGAEPSSSGGRPSGSDTKLKTTKELGLQDFVLSSSVQVILSMGFSYPQAIEAYRVLVRTWIQWCATFWKLIAGVGERVN